jgi:hypothetical protein
MLADSKFANFEEFSSWETRRLTRMSFCAQPPLLGDAISKSLLLFEFLVLSFVEFIVVVIRLVIEEKPFCIINPRRVICGSLCAVCSRRAKA